MGAKLGGPLGEGTAVFGLLAAAANTAEAPHTVGAGEGTGRSNERHGWWCLPSPLVGSYHRILARNLLVGERVGVVGCCCCC